MQARYLAKYTRGILIGFVLLLLGTGVSEAAVFFSSTAESGTCGNPVPLSEWDNGGSGGPGGAANAKMYYQCDTPIPGRTKYFRIGPTAQDSQGTWNQRFVNQMNLTPGKTYYLGAFFRFDRINGRNIWHDADGIPDSSDKLFEFGGSGTRALIMVGFPGWASCRNNACRNHFTFGVGITGSTCSGCLDQIVWGWPNIAPYGTFPGSGVSSSGPIYNYYLADYEKWYAVVLGFTPSNGNTPNGRIRFWINGILTTDTPNVKTQDASSPNLEHYFHSGTIAQPAYDSPPHYRKFDHFIFSDSLVDIQNAGLMSDPEAGSGPNPPTNLRVQ